ncbi:hypothetical protein CDL12_26848 [Handroanthus impetiginosus]|uniref:Replication factor A C-terminal domain-containing protein n=1 Tax=Handroanthus impetiginosus TaxID=429701 RepID=A0A2G9G6U4_9LAMI|nr:hypothetical protein CDL12_26848 [Handroanthus impetiginosus]
MAQRLVHIEDVTPDLRSWSVKVLVQSKIGERKSNRMPKKYQHVTFIDEEGTKVLATLFDDAIKLFKNTLPLYYSYIISNSRVIVANPNYENYGQRCTWVVMQKTVITRVLDMLYLLGIVIKKCEQRMIGSPPNNYVIREFVLLNEEYGILSCILKKHMILSLWNNIALSEGKNIMDADDLMRITFVNKLIVTSYFGLSVGSTPLITIVVNPPIPDVQRLKIGGQTIMQQLQAFCLMKFFSITEIARNNDGDKFMVRAKIEVTKSDKKFFYVACDNYYASYAVDSYWEIDCPWCNKRVFTKPRERVIANIIDDTRSIQAIAFGLDAVKIMNMNAVLAMGMYNVMSQDIKAKTFFIKLKKSSKERRDGTRVQYTVLSLADTTKQIF